MNLLQMASEIAELKAQLARREEMLARSEEQVCKRGFETTDPWAKIFEKGRSREVPQKDQDF